MYIEYVVAVVSNSVVQLRSVERKRGFALAFAKLMPPS